MTFHMKPRGGISGHVSHVDLIECADGLAMRVSIDVVFPGLPEKFCIDITADCPHENTMNLLIVAEDKNKRKK